MRMASEWLFSTLDLRGARGRSGQAPAPPLGAPAVWAPAGARSPIAGFAAPLPRARGPRACGRLRLFRRSGLATAP